MRIPTRVETLLPDEERPRFLGYLADLSETGAFVQCLSPRPLGTQFSLLLHLPGGPGPGVACRGEVIWTRHYESVKGPCAGMGIRILEVIGREARKFLEGFCLEADPLERAGSSSRKLKK